MTIGEMIRTARKEVGWTQAQLGKELNVSGAMIGQWENDLRNPKSETIGRIADALGQPFIDLFMAESDEFSRKTRERMDAIRGRKYTPTETDRRAEEIFQTIFAPKLDPDDINAEIDARCEAHRIAVEEEETAFRHKVIEEARSDIEAFVDSENGIQIILAYCDLNDEGRNEAVSRIMEMTEMRKFQRTAPAEQAETPTEPLAEDGQGKSSTEQEKPPAGQISPIDGK